MYASRQSGWRPQARNEGWPQGPAGKKRFPSRSGSQSAPGEQSQRQKAAPLRGYIATAPRIIAEPGVPTTLDSSPLGLAEGVGMKTNLCFGGHFQEPEPHVPVPNSDKIAAVL